MAWAVLFFDAQARETVPCLHGILLPGRQYIEQSCEMYCVQQSCQRKGRHDAQARETVPCIQFIWKNDECRFNSSRINISRFNIKGII